MSPPPTLRVNRGWFWLHCTGQVQTELRAATPQWRKALLDRHPRAVRLVNGYRKDAPAMIRAVDSVDLLPFATVPPNVAAAHGFTGEWPIIRLWLAPVHPGLKCPP
jgi:hypothetical protein